MRERITRIKLGALVLPLALIAFALALAVPGLQPLRAQTIGTDAVKIATVPPERTALVETVPITKKAGKKKRSVMSLSLNSLARLSPENTLSGAGEVSVSVCLKPNLRHTSSRDDCVGKLYGFDPKVSAQLVLADSPSAVGGPSTATVGKAKRLKCTQKQPNRNHHCSLAISWRDLDPGALANLSCAPSTCLLNLVVDASHKKAKSGNKLIIGGIRDGSYIDNTGAARIYAVTYSPGSLARPSPRVDQTPRTPRKPIVDDGDSPNLEVVYSVEVPKPRAGEKLVIEGRYAAAINAVNYNVRARSQVILSDSPTSTSPKGRVSKVAEESTRIGEENNFNCTQGKSGHKNPCPITKPGVISFRNSSSQSVYVNLIAGHGALLNANQRWNGSDRVRVGSGYLKVWRYP